MAMNKSRENEPRMNDQIKNTTIRLIDADGNMIGIVPLKQGMDLAEQHGLDLVEISLPAACMQGVGLWKFKYEAQKKANEARKAESDFAEEIKTRPNIDPHDYGIKMKNVRKFIEDGDKVNLPCVFVAAK